MRVRMILGCLARNKPSSALSRCRDGRVKERREEIEENHKVGRSEAPSLPVAKTVGQARRCLRRWMTN